MIHSFVHALMHVFSDLSVTHVTDIVSNSITVTHSFVRSVPHVSDSITVIRLSASGVER